MLSIEDRLKQIKAEAVLDVATGRGDFLLTLKEALGEFGSGTGIDCKFSNEWEAGRFTGLPVRFVVMDASSLQFEDEKFDLVAISNSLHHMADPARVMAEMIRVLQPGGWFIFYEMIADDQDPAQQTHTLLHQWWGKVDTAAGVFHRSPYLRQQLIDFLNSSGLVDLEYIYDFDLSQDPMNTETLAELDRIITTYQGKTQDSALIAEGEELRQRVTTAGFLPATELWAIGRKKVE